MDDYERAVEAGARELYGVLDGERPLNNELAGAHRCLQAALAALFPTPGQYAVEKREDGEVVVLGRLHLHPPEGSETLPSLRLSSEEET